MDLTNQQLCRKLGITKPLGDRQWNQPDSDGIVDWDGTGTVFYCGFFPHIPAIAKLQWGRLPMPGQCFVCGANVWATYTFVSETRNPFQLRHLFSRVRGIVSLCKDHAGHSPQFLFCVYAHDSFRYSHCEMFSTNRAFLLQVKELNTRHEMYPPWIVFPGSDPNLGWGQGTAQHWRHDAWNPYWDGLSQPEREKYLHNWAAPAEWAEFLTHPPQHFWGEESPSPQCQ